MHARGPQEPGRSRSPPPRERKRPSASANEARGGDDEEVGAPHSTDEAGEPTRGTPRREGGAGSRNRWRERWRRHRARNRLNETRTDSGTGEGKRPAMRFTTLAHHIDIDWLREAYRRTRKDGAAGVDGQTATDYAAEPGGQPPSRCWTAPSPARTERRRCGGCTSRRAIGSETRPIGIPTFEDKVLQRAVVMVLEAVYEQDFLDCSYGFRPGRSAHQALDALWHADDGDGRRLGPGGRHPRSFSTRWTTRHLREMLRQRVRDGVLLRLIGKWLNAGVLEDGCADAPRSRHAAGRGDLAAPGERLPARSAGRMVRAGRSSRG